MVTASVCVSRPTPVWRGHLGAAAMLSAEEILCNTQQVISGLEALRGENRSLLESLQPPEESLPASESNSVDQEKCGILRQSLDRIELGLSEAQVLKETQYSDILFIEILFDSALLTFWHFNCGLVCGIITSLLSFSLVETNKKV